MMDLKNKLEKSRTKIKFEQISTILDEILSCQRSLPEETATGYNNEKEVN